TEGGGRGEVRRRVARLEDRMGGRGCQRDREGKGREGMTRLHGSPPLVERTILRQSRVACPDAPAVVSARRREGAATTGRGAAPARRCRACGAGIRTA